MHTTAWFGLGKEGLRPPWRRVRMLEMIFLQIHVSCRMCAGVSLTEISSWCYDWQCWEQGHIQGACSICGLYETFKENLSIGLHHVEAVRVFVNLTTGPWSVTLWALLASSSDNLCEWKAVCNTQCNEMTIAVNEPVIVTKWWKEANVWWLRRIKLFCCLKG